MRRSTCALALAVVACGGRPFTAASTSTSNADASATVDAATTDAGSPDGGPKKCYVLSFDGVDDFVTIPHKSQLDLTTYTIEARINPDATANGGGCNAEEMHIFAHQRFNTAGYALILICGGLQLRNHASNGPGGTLADGPLSPLGGTWIAATGVYDGATKHMRMYTDGNRIADQTGDPPSPYGADARIGAAAYEDNFFFKGLIDEVRISRTARYAAAQYTTSAKLAVDADTIALWHFDEDGQTVRDETGNFDGYLGSTPGVDSHDPARIEVPCP